MMLDGTNRQAHVGILGEHPTDEIRKKVVNFIGDYYLTSANVVEKSIDNRN